MSDLQLPRASTARGPEILCLALTLLCVLASASARASSAPPAARPAALTLINAWTLDGDQVGCEFGDSVTTAGDVNADGYSDVLVSAPFHDGAFVDEGRVYLFLGGPAGLATTPAWTHDGGQAGAHFGVAVNCAGDVNADGYDDVIVGANRYDAGQTDEGRAYVFLGGASGLANAPVWVTEANQAGAYYGHAVAGVGDVNGDGFDDVMVGADWFDNGLTDEGRAYLFYGSAAGVSTTPAWTVDGDNTDAYLGAPVAAAGDVNGDGYADIAVGAFDFSIPQSQGEGRAYVYLGGPSGPAVAPVFTVEGVYPQAGMGTSMGTAGDVNGDGYADLIVGASRYADGNGGNAGKAALYLGSAAGPDTTADWVKTSSNVDARLGGMVSTAGDVNGDGYADVLVAAWNDRAPYYDEGVAWLYLGSAAGLDTSAAWTASGDTINVHYGWSLDTAGDVNGDGYSDFIVSSPLHSNGLYKQGRAYLYLGAPSAPADRAAWTLTGNQNGATVGTALAFAGDVDGDGFSDLLAGVPLYDHGQTDEGRAVLFRGSATGFAAASDWSYESNQAGAQAGGTVASAGDVNGDGYTDVVVGAPLYDTPATDAGRAWLFLGAPGGLGTSPAWTASGWQANAHFGSAVAGIGDVNGDGYADIAVSAAQLDTSGTDAGAVYAYLGSASGLSATPAWVQKGDIANGQFGVTVSGAGDIDRDGYGDLLIGQPYRTGSFSGEGRAWLFRGGPSGLATSASWTYDGGQINANCGLALGDAGDVNGDSYADAVIAAPGGTKTLAAEGVVRLFLGGAGGLAATPVWTVSGGEANARFGTAADGAGDLDGDGYADIAVGAPLMDSTTADVGAVAVFAGAAAGPAATPRWITYGDQAGASFGRTLAGRGDATGDGMADLAVAAPLYQLSISLQRVGRMVLYPGNAAAGPPRLARQRRADDSAPLDLNALIAPPSLRLAYSARTPAGRGPVWVEWEVAPVGVAFDGVPDGSSPVLDTGVPGAGTGSAAAYSALVSSIAQAGGYHWRMRTRSSQPRFARSPWVSFVPAGATEAAFRSNASIVGVGEPGREPALSLALRAPRPNPAREQVEVRFVLPRAAAARVAVFDPRGRWVADLAQGPQSAGEHAVRWSLRDAGGRRVAAGRYFVRLELDDVVRTRAITVSR